jgi:hypothetical protein
MKFALVIIQCLQKISILGSGQGKSSSLPPMSHVHSLVRGKNEACTADEAVNTDRLLPPHQ